MRRSLSALMIIGTLIFCAAGTVARADDAGAQISHEFVFKPDAGSTAKAVNLAGDFNGWSTTATPMVKADDGTFRVSVKLTPGKHTYKFILDSTTWINDPAADKLLEEDDGQKGRNSAVIIAVSDKPAAVAIDHTFTYRPSDGTAPKSVNVAGDFNKWSTDAQPMTRGEDGTFSAKLKLPPGTYQYKFVIEGTKWMNDPAADKTLEKPDGNGGANSVLIIK